MKVMCVVADDADASSMRWWSIDRRFMNQSQKPPVDQISRPTVAISRALEPTWAEGGRASASETGSSAGSWPSMFSKNSDRRPTAAAGSVCSFFFSAPGFHPPCAFYAPIQRPLPVPARPRSILTTPNQVLEAADRAPGLRIRWWTGGARGAGAGGASAAAENVVRSDPGRGHSGQWGRRVGSRDGGDRRRTGIWGLEAACSTPRPVLGGGVMPQRGGGRQRGAASLSLGASFFAFDGPRP